MIKDPKTTALAGLLLGVATLACLGLYSLLGEAADLVLMALGGLWGLVVVVREANKRVQMDDAG